MHAGGVIARWRAGQCKPWGISSSINNHLPPLLSTEGCNFLAARLSEALSRTGFHYLMNLGLTYTHQDVFGLCDEFFGSKELSLEKNIKMRGTLLLTQTPTITASISSDTRHSLLN